MPWESGGFFTSKDRGKPGEHMDKNMKHPIIQVWERWIYCRVFFVFIDGFWEFLRYALRLHLLFSLFGDKSNTSMDMSGSGRIPPLPNVLVYLLSYNLVAAAGTELWLTWEKQESGAGMIWPGNLAPEIERGRATSWEKMLNGTN